MSTKQRTSLSITSEALAAAQARRESLGYDSLSEYIEFLILEDARQKRSHSVIRDEKGVRYETTPSGTEKSGPVTRVIYSDRNAGTTASVNEPSDFPDAGTAPLGQLSPGARKSGSASS